MKVLVVGSGGREHAVCRKLHEDGAELYNFMNNRNPGIAAISKKTEVGNELDYKTIVKFAKSNTVDLVFIGPDPVLDTPLADTLAREGIKVASPSRSAARIETSKEYMRELLANHSIDQNMVHMTFSEDEELRKWIGNFDGEFVVKPLGLTGGKGVRVMGDHFDTAASGIAIAENIMKKDGKVLIEEKLTGEEFSVQVFSDGSKVYTMPVAQDYKRAYEGDTGPNTGGMGSITDSNFGLPFIKQSTVKKSREIMQKVVTALKEEGNPFHGILYGQFMATAHGPMIVEINARYADPEGINVLSIMNSSLLDTLIGIAEGKMTKAPSFRRKATVLKYIVPRGYGSSPKLGYLTVPKFSKTDNGRLYYATVKGTLSNVEMTTSRAIACIGISDSIPESSAIVDEMVTRIGGDFYYRKDIGREEYINSKIARMNVIRNSGS